MEIDVSKIDLASISWTLDLTVSTMAAAFAVNTQVSSLKTRLMAYRY